MRILLIQPPLEDFYITQQRMQPTGLLYLASALEKAGHQVKILDLLTSHGASTILVDPELGYLSEHYTHDLSPFKIFTDYHRFGATAEQAKKLISEEDFDVCGISANFTAYWKQPLEIARLVKELDPSLPVILGGNAVPVIWEKALESGAVDFIVFGEGENTAVKLLKNLDDPVRVKNIAFRKEERSVRTEVEANFDIDFSRLDLKYLQTGNYRIGRRKMASIVTSRGCPLKCAYCTATLNCLAPFQYRNLDNVFMEISALVKGHDIGALNIEDENFTLNKEYARAFLERKAAEFPSLRLYFMNGLHYPSLDQELLVLLRRADCLNLGIALVDTQNTELIARPADMKQFETVIRAALVLGFLTTVYVIVGLPGQSAVSVKKMIDMLHGLGAVVAVSIYYPMPGTPLFDEWIVKDLAMASISWMQMRSSAMAFEQKDLSRKEMVDLFRYTRMINSSIEPVSLPDFSTENKGDNRVLRMEKRFSPDELKTYLYLRFKEQNEFLVLEEQKNGQYGADYFFRVKTSSL